MPLSLASRRRTPSVLLMTPHCSGAKDTGPMSHSQRLQTLTAGGRTHGSRHQADLQTCGWRRHKRQQCAGLLTPEMLLRDLALQ